MTRIGEIGVGVLLAGVLAPLTLQALPTSVQGSGALLGVAILSVALVMGVSWFVRRSRARPRQR